MRYSAYKMQLKPVKVSTPLIVALDVVLEMERSRTLG